MEQYYYNLMNNPQQPTYHTIFAGLKNLSEEIKVPAFSGEELYKDRRAVVRGRSEDLVGGGIIKKKNRR